MPFDVFETTPLPLATSAQRAKLYALTQACTLARGKTANIYTDGRYAFRVAHDFEMLQKQHSFLIPAGRKSRTVLMLRNY